VTKRKKPKNVWNNHQISILKKNYFKASKKKLLNLFKHRNWNSIRARANLLKLERKQKTGKCRVCKKKFTRRSSSNVICKNIHCKEKNSEKYRQNRKKLIRPCLVCNKEFIPRKFKRTREKIFCSRDCYNSTVGFKKIFKEEQIKKFNFTEIYKKYGLYLEPKHETDVLILFSKLHKKLGFEYIIKADSFGFPDIIALKNKKVVTIELEYKSSNFLLHKHPLCDYLICWIEDKKIHNIITIELSSLI
jgi:hypothetical protein